MTPDDGRLPELKPGTPRIVVIGAGAVGLYLASQLARSGWETVVVESGGAHLAGFAPDSFAVAGRNHEGIRTGRSRSLGGTSNLWGGQLVEFQPVDFEGRAWMPGSRWPVRHEEIRPYYRKAYEVLGIPAEFCDDRAVWETIGKGRPELTEELEVFLTRWLKVPSFAVLFRNEIQASERLIVLTGRTAVGFGYTGDRVSEVRLKDEAGNPSRVAGDYFVLANGTIETARLLLHCAKSEAGCPWCANPHIGRWFQDHLGGRIGKVHAKSPQRFFDVFSTVAVQMFKFAPKIRMKNEVLVREHTLNVQAMVDFESSVSENLVYLKQFLKAAIFSRRLAGVSDLLKNIRACARYLFPLMWRFVHDHRIFVPSDSKISILVQAEQTPGRDSRIAIDPAVRDQYGLPKAVLDWRLGGHELESIRVFALKIKAALAACELGELEIDDRLLAMDPRFLDSLRDTTHQAGGAVMGESADDGVVDRDLRVFGTANFYVAGAATFRTSSNANTTFTALAFAARLADHLAARASLSRMP